MSTRAALCVVAALVAVYLALLHRQLRKGHPDARARPLPTDDELWRISEYEDIEARELEGIRPLEEQYGVAVVGASGLLGRALVRLLRRRGHRFVRLIDVVPPPADLLDDAHCDFRRVNLTDAEAIRSALHEPFAELGQPPRVVYCPATALRFWERSKATKHLTMRVNVDGVAKLVEAMRTSPVRGAILVYTSSVAVSVKAPLYCRLGLDRRHARYDHPLHSDEDEELPLELLGGGHYSVSKAIAEKGVLAANSQDGLKTIALRLGMAVVGPTDRFISIYLRAIATPTFLAQYSQNAICCRDAARAHIMAADALLDDKRADGIAGQHFLVTGEPGWDGAWNFYAVRYMCQLFSRRNLHFIPLPEIIAYAMAHAFELLCALSMAIGASPTPKWLGDSIYLQPATFEPCIDVGIDDSRFRKLVGYRHLWSTPQSIRWIAEEVNKEQAARKSVPSRDLKKGPLAPVAEIKRD